MKTNKLWLIPLAIIVLSSIVFGAIPAPLPYDVEISSGKVYATSNNEIKADIYLINRGLDISANMYLVEMQIKQGLCSNLMPFATSVSLQKNCDAMHPLDVHKQIYNWWDGEKGSATDTLGYFSLKSPSLPAGTYCVWIISADKCCPTASCSATTPFKWGRQVGEITIPKTAVTPAIICGNAKCEVGENYGNCKSDCHSYCGDGYCSGIEDNTCADCQGNDGGTPPAPVICTKDTTSLCPDGSTITTGKCLNGALVNIETICPEKQTETTETNSYWIYIVLFAGVVGFVSALKQLKIL